MDAFLAHKRPRSSEDLRTSVKETETSFEASSGLAAEEESTEYKLAVLASLYPSRDEEILLEALLLSDGSITKASEVIESDRRAPKKRRSTGVGAGGSIGHQSSLSSFVVPSSSSSSPEKKCASSKPLTKRGQTLHLYRPEDVEAHTPCSIIHNFLRAEEADALLQELLVEVTTYRRTTFQLFDRVVSTSHGFCVYADGSESVERQKKCYTYDGKPPEDVRPLPPEMKKASGKVEQAVNLEVQRRIRDFYPGGQKLKYQSQARWRPNAAFVNCYAGPRESLGYHSDELTYLGPRAVIGSLSLGVAREFRVRRVIPEDDEHRRDDGSLADAQGQIAIHLPHNSLLVMHAEMQEEWKHSIAPAQTIDPHPLSKNMRINITYRHFRESFAPESLPTCKCGALPILRCVQRKKDNHGRYMWMCHASYIPGNKGCSFFQWAHFDADGEPLWSVGSTSV